MYGQTNYGSQFGQGQTPVPPANQQRPPAPPPPPLNFQQGSSPAAPPHVIQQAISAVSPQIGQLGPYLYQHGFVAPHPTAHQSPPVPFSGMPNTGQSYGHPPPPVHGSTLASQCYSSVRHSVQHPSPTRNQNIQRIHPPALVTPHGSPSCPNMSQAAVPHGALPPPPPPPTNTTSGCPAQGPSSYKALYPAQPQAGLQHIPPPPPHPPPPPASNLVPPTSFITSGHSTAGSSQMASMAPLPPASPQSPSAPLPTAASPSSSFPNIDASKLPGYPDIDHRSNNLPFTELRALDSFDEVTASNQFKHITSVHECSQNFEGGSEYEAGSLARDGVSSTGTVILDFSSPPPKPSDEKVVHKIDSFCQLIAKNGPGIEDITRQNESRNPEFEFLFGGEPGSGAAVAHEYFLWMKKKCILACKLDERKIESPLKSLGIDSSSQPDHFMVSLPADSDMEMEDDITLSDGDQEVHDSTDALNRNSDVIHGELDVKKHLHRAQSSPGWTAPQAVSCEKVSSSLSSELCKQSEGTNHFLDQCQLIVEKAPSRVDVYSTGASESPLASEQEKSSIPIADDQNTLGAFVDAEAINSDRVSNQSITVNSPFRLLQDYSSEKSSENDLDGFFEDVNVVIAPSSVTTSVKSSHKDAGSHFEIGSDSLCMTDKMSGMQYESRRSKFSLDTKKEVKGTSTTLTIESHEGSQGKDASNGAPIDIVSKRNKSQAGKNTKSESVLPKVDEYGRLVREGSSDSSSDGSRYNKRHSKRGRSRGRIRSRSRSHSRSRIRSRSRSRTRSRSRSPLDSRRRRRSPRRRREKQNRSPSWSSRNQRSRSRSPTFRRAGEFRDENKRQDRHHIPECFDFLRGRCYRGAKCRYMHREHDKNDGSWRHRSKQKHLEFQPSLKDSRIKEEIEDSSDMNLYDEIKGQDMQLCQDVATKDGQYIDPDKTYCDSSRVAAATMQVKQILQVKSEETIAHNPDEREVLESLHPSPQMMSCADNMKSCGLTSQAIEQSRSNNSARQLRKADFPSQQMEVSPLSDSSPDRPFMTSPNKISSIEPSPGAILTTHSRPIESSNAQPFSSGQFSSGQFSSKFMAPKESPLPSFSANSSYPSQLPLPPPPPPPPPSLSQGTSAAHVPQSHRDYNQMLLYPVQSIPTGIIHSYQGPLPSQHAQFSVSQDSPWTSLPPPPPRPLYDSSLNAGTAARGASSQFQQNQLAPRSDFGSQSSMRPYGPYPTELPHSKGEFLHQMYPTLSELPHPPPNREDFGSGNPSNQPFGGLGLMREDRFTHAPVQDVNSSRSFAHGHTHPQPAPSSQDLTMIKMQNFSGDNFPSGELSNSSSQIHPHSQNQQPSCGVQYSVGDSILGVPGKTGVQYPVGGSILGLPGKDGPMSRYRPDILDKSQFSGVPDFGPSRIQTHHNPYAATFEQPLSSKYSSNIVIQEKNAPGVNMFDTLVQAPVDGQGVGSAGSRQTTSSPSSARAVGQLLPKADGEQYDPLFDSIEPSPNPLNKNNHSHMPTSDSNTMVRLSGSCEPLDVEENNKHTEVGPVASATSMDNDGYGETADAEVGVVEDESHSDDDGAANMAAGEIEIDQVKSTGKSKKKKDSRSTRLFKSAIADFVKDLLKPSWRQGNMSKEAFKTIVKKTVDKVSGAMKSHQIPKSQEKIDRYIDSSQRKLTKLVMGYVDKYVKV